MANNHPIIDAVGVEIEIMDLTRNQLSYDKELSRLGWKITRDASVETRLVTTDEFALIEDPDFPLSNKNSETKIGAELVSNVINTGEVDILQMFKTTTGLLASKGEGDMSERASIHYHISYPFNLRILKAVIRLAANMEDIFFQLGCMGYTHRGESNNATYCRPITGKGPAVIKDYAGRPVQIFNTPDLLEVDKLTEFWSRYGNLDNMAIAEQRYVPVRYHWINLKSLLNQGSLEFRVFNTTLNPLFIWATLTFCQSFASFCTEGNNTYSNMKKLNLVKENSVFSPRSKTEMIKVLDDFAELSDLDDYALEILKDIIEFSPDVQLENSYIYSHLKSIPNHWTEGEYLAPKITGKIKKPNFVDIHVLDRARRDEVEAEPRIAGGSQPDNPEFEFVPYTGNTTASTRRVRDTVTRLSREYTAEFFTPDEEEDF